MRIGSACESLPVIDPGAPQCQPPIRTICVSAWWTRSKPADRAAALPVSSRSASVPRSVGRNASRKPAVARRVQPAAIVSPGLSRPIRTGFWHRSKPSRTRRWRRSGPVCATRMASGKASRACGGFSPVMALYPVQARIRNFVGLMTRKLSVTRSQYSRQFAGTSSRRKVSIAVLKSRKVA